MRPLHGATVPLKDTAAKQVIGKICDRVRVAFGFDELAEQFLEFLDRKSLLRVACEARQKLTFCFKIHCIRVVRVASDLEFNETTNESAHCWSAELANAVLTLFEHDRDGERILGQGPSHFGEAVQEAEAAQAERLVVEGLKRIETLGGSFAALSDLLELDALQIKVARNLCQSRMGIYEVLGASGAGLRLRELVTDCMISRAASKAGRAI